MSGLIYTRRCVICGSDNIVCASGHVVRRNTFINSKQENQDIHIIAGRCFDHRDTKSLNEMTGYFGLYQEWMGMCDDPFNQ
jgi:hypothetical protein